MTEKYGNSKVRVHLLSNGGEILVSYPIKERKIVSGWKVKVFTLIV